MRALPEADGRVSPQPAAAAKVWTPSTIARAVKELAEGQIGRVWVEGEVSNFICRYE